MRGVAAVFGRGAKVVDRPAGISRRAGCGFGQFVGQCLAFENTFGVTAGDFASGLLHPGQMWDKRPVPGWANYRTPIRNLFMCGSACHPGPGVTCIPGYNGAREVLKNWKS